MDWTLLAIEPTKDKKAITAAYRARLAYVNPEDKPEEFKALRGAYEEALRLAGQEDSPSQSGQDPVARWSARLRALYDDFPARIQPENWEALLGDELCLALDTRPRIEEALLRFLMEDYYIPQGVWQVLDRAFHWLERSQELYEHYPRDFVDYAVLNGIRYQPSLPYELFIPGRNGRHCDDYRRLYHRANQAAPAEMGPVLDQMEALRESHPYGQALRHRLELEQGQIGQALAGYRQLAQAYPDDATLAMALASVLARNGGWTEAEALTRRVLKQNSSHWQAKRLLADCLAQQGQYEEAKDHIYDLMRAAGGDQKQAYELTDVLKTWNEQWISQLEQRLQAHPEDGDSALKLGWCYLQNDRLDDALRAAECADSGTVDPYDYHNLHGKLRYGRNEFDKALAHLQQAEELIRQTPKDHPKAEERSSTLPKLMQMQGYCLMQLGQEEAGRAKYEQSLELAPEDPEVLTFMGRLLYADRNYERAAQLFEHLTCVMPSSYHGYYLLAMALYETGRDRDAFAAINHALQIEGSDLGVYTLKMRILLRNGVWDGTREILDFLQKNNVGNELSVLWCAAQLTELEQKDEVKALEEYRAIATRIENGEQLPWASQVYYRIAMLLGEQRDADNEEHRKELLAVLEKGLAHNSQDGDCLNYKAWLLKRGGQDEEALTIYHHLEARPRHSLNIERNLAELYYRDLRRNAHKSLHYYLLLLQQEENADLHFYVGTCRRYLGEYEAAEQNFLREQELAPDDIDGYNGLAFVYEGLNRQEAALVQVNKAIALVQSRERDYSWLYAHKVKLLRRLNRPQEALEAVSEAMKRYGYPAGYEIRFDICCQFGLWEQAQTMLDEWIKSKHKKERAKAAAIQLQLYTGHMLKARMALTTGKSTLTAADLERLKLQMAELDCDAAPQIQIWEKRLQHAGDNTHALMNLAQTYCWEGDMENARKYAARAVEELDKYLKLHLKDEALYRSRRCMALAILGRMDEARAELAAVRSLPLCEGCAYCSCKDADIFQANMEEVCGNWQKAMELHRAGQERWPDDLDFASGAARMKRKGI